MTKRKDDWFARAEAELRGRPLDALTWHSPEGIDVEPIYTAEDMLGLVYGRGVQCLLSQGS